MYSSNIRNGVRYDPEEDYQNAMGKLYALKENLPKYNDSYGQSLQELYREITERPKFTYDANEDALYQSYKQAYGQMGRLAMEDAIGQTAALTGGYGSSYGQSVGQQQYDAYLQKLGDIYPELYSMAYNRYQDEGNALQQEYDRMLEVSDAEYEKYLDKLDAYYKEVDDLQERADIAYDRGQDAYDRLAEMMLTMGYVPDGEELKAAGMSDAHKDAYLSYYNTLHTAPTGSGKGKKKDEDAEEEVYDSLLQAARGRMAKGESAESINGEIARRVARGELDADTARKLITAVTKAQFA